MLVYRLIVPPRVSIRQDLFSLQRRPPIINCTVSFSPMTTASIYTPYRPFMACYTYMHTLGPPSCFANELFQWFHAHPGLPPPSRALRCAGVRTQNMLFFPRGDPFFAQQICTVWYTFERPVFNRKYDGCNCQILE